MTASLADSVMEFLQGFSDPLFTPTPVFPGQLRTGSRQDAAINGELALRLAILEDAIRCLALGHRARAIPDRRLAREAEAWIRTLDHRWPFSFPNVCDALGIDAPWLRRKLLELRYPATLGGVHAPTERAS